MSGVKLCEGVPRENVTVFEALYLQYHSAEK